MSAISKILKNWLPPALVQRLRSMRSNGIRFEGKFKSWEEAASLCTGYDADSILNKVLEASLKVKLGEARFERDSVIFDEVQYSWPVTTALMWAAARNKGSVHVLDFGGSLGSSYFQNKKFLAELREVSWSVVEQNNFADVGNRKIADDSLSFYKNIEDVSANIKVDLILISSVLQYLRDPLSVLKDLSQLQSNLIVIDRTPFSVDLTEKIKIQHVPAKIYSASYPCWFFNRDKLMQKMIELNYQMVETFDSIEKPSIEAKWQGFIFEKVG